LWRAFAPSFQNRRSTAAGQAWIAPPEYVVPRKLEFLREGGQDKHVCDIRFILAARSGFTSAWSASRGNAAKLAEWALFSV
jgi:hypothetical protein